VVISHAARSETYLVCWPRIGVVLPVRCDATGWTTRYAAGKRNGVLWRE